jgi:hypothetical protein
MTGNGKTAKSEGLNARQVSPEELSAAELNAVSGGWSVDFGLFKVTGGDVANAAKWVWNHL